MTEVLSKKDLVAKIAEDNGITKVAATEEVKHVLEGIAGVLKENNTLKLTGFATFTSEFKEAHTREVYDFQKGEKKVVELPAKYIHRVKLSKSITK